MAQKTIFGDAEVTLFMEVKKADGRTIYYKVISENNIEITKEEYNLLTKNK